MRNEMYPMRYAAHVIALAGLLGLGACHSPQLGSQTDNEVDLVQQGVTITSYNYTNRALNDITVDGVWAGGLGAYRGGGKRFAGLLAPEDRGRQHSVKVRWEVQDYYDIETNKYLRPAPSPEPREALVPIKFPYPQKIEYLILHFYPDGHVEAELTERVPGPRILPPRGFQR